jgi:hypothetical protein
MPPRAADGETGSRRTAWRASGLVILIALCAVSVSACGSSASGSSGDATSKQEQARLDAAKCFRQHGVNVPDPGQGGQGGAGGPPGGLRNSNPQAFQAARQACQKYLKNAFTPLTAAQRTQFRDAFVKYAACMRTNGVNLPDPQPGNGPGQGGGQRFSQLRSQPNFAAANAKCRSLRPQRPGGGRGFGFGR